MKEKQGQIEKMRQDWELDVTSLKKEKDVMSQNLAIVQSEIEAKTLAYLNIQTNYKLKEQENKQLLKQISFMERCETFKGSSSQIPQVPVGRLSTVSTTSNYLNSANINQDDEVGEEFNNYFLSDLKNGNGGSQFSIDSTYSTTELQKRNSMYPQHMRGSYAMCQLDFPLSEQEIKVRELYEVVKHLTNK